jgi:hypothetical protein
MKRFLYAVRPTLEILGDTIAILLDRELERPWDQIFAENKGEWKKKVHIINKRGICNYSRNKGKCKEK